MYVYDEASGQWQSAAPLPQSLSSHRCTVMKCQGLVCGGVSGNEVFLFSSSSTNSSLQDISKQCYLFDGRLWTARLPLLTYRLYPAMATYRGALNRYLTCTTLFWFCQNKNVFVLTGQNTIAKQKKSFALVLPKTKTKHKIVQVRSLFFHEFSTPKDMHTFSADGHVNMHAATIAPRSPR